MNPWVSPTGNSGDMSAGRFHIASRWRKKEKGNGSIENINVNLPHQQPIQPDTPPEDEFLQVHLGTSLRCCATVFATDLGQMRRRLAPCMYVEKGSKNI